MRNAIHAKFIEYTQTEEWWETDLEILRKLRNRIAHHESIYTRNLTRDFGILCSVIGFMEKDVSDFVRSHSRVEAIIVDKDDELRGTSKLSF